MPDSSLVSETFQELCRKKVIWQSWECTLRWIIFELEIMRLQHLPNEMGFSQRTSPLEINLRNPMSCSFTESIFNRFNHESMTNGVFFSIRGGLPAQMHEARDKVNWWDVLMLLFPSPLAPWAHLRHLPSSGRWHSLSSLHVTTILRMHNMPTGSKACIFSLIFNIFSNFDNCPEIQSPLSFTVSRLVSSAPHPPALLIHS